MPVIKRCPNCGTFFTHYNAKFCGQECFREWRLKHAKKDKKTNRARRRQLVRDYVEGFITREEYIRKRDEYKKHGLWD